MKKYFFFEKISDQADFFLFLILSVRQGQVWMVMNEDEIYPVSDTMANPSTRKFSHQLHMLATEKTQV